MLSGINNSIEIVKVYKCGYCINDLGLLYKEYKYGSKFKFFANCILIKHKEHGLILVDTGYGESIKSLNLVKIVYNKLNYAVINKEDTITYQLKKDGIEPEEINYVFLTHFHPDHIGEIKKFKKAKFITSFTLFKKSLNNLLVCKEDIPKDFLQRLIDIDKMQVINTKYFNRVVDIFGDKNILAVELSGHVKGQIGLIIPSNKIIFVADACWLRAEILSKLTLRIAPKVIHQDIKKYLSTQQKIKNFLKEQREYCLICSHDNV